MLYNYQAKILKIVDGDTLQVEFDLGFHIKFTETVRLYGINTPELHGSDRENAIKAKLRVEQLLPIGSIVTISTIKDEKEKYGRYLAKIFLNSIDNTTINDILVKENLAKPFMIG